MDRAGALAWLQNAGYASALTDAERLTTDTPQGLKYVLDRAFALYIKVNGLNTTVTTTTVDDADEYTFTVILEACLVDMLMRHYARMVDISVDAPLTSVKASQAFRQFESMGARLWKEAEALGYTNVTNVGGWAINLDYIEPSGNDE